MHIQTKTFIFHVAYTSAIHRNKQTRIFHQMYYNCTFTFTIKTVRNAACIRDHFRRRRDQNMLNIRQRHQSIDGWEK